MAKKIIEYRDKRYQVVRLKTVDLSDVCKGCALWGEKWQCGNPCTDYHDEIRSLFYILKEIKNGTK